MLRPSQLVLTPGTRVENFEIESRLGRGGFGATYLATEYSIRLSADDPEPVLRRVVVKEYFPRNIAWRVDGSRVIPVEEDDDARAKFFAGLRAFIKEAQAIARLDHPGIVRIHRVFESHGTAYYTMPWIVGRPLSAVLKEKQCLSWEEIQRVLLPVLDAVDEAHRNGILHRDIKPDNILVSEDGRRSILIDFGTARMQVTDPDAPMTRPSELVAYTPGYAPVEQYDRAATGNKHGFFTDVYALCATLYQAVTGIVPPQAIQRYIEVVPGRADPMVPVAQACSRPHEYPLSLFQAIEWGLQVQSQDRPQTIAELRDAIGAGVGVPAAARSRAELPQAAVETAFAEPTAETARPTTASMVSGARSEPYVARLQGPEGEWVQAGATLDGDAASGNDRVILAAWDTIVESGLAFALRVQVRDRTAEARFVVQAPSAKRNLVVSTLSALSAASEQRVVPCVDRGSFDALLTRFPSRRLSWAVTGYRAREVSVLPPVAWVAVLGEVFALARRDGFDLAYQINARPCSIDLEVVRAWRKQLARLQAADAPAALVKSQDALLQRYLGAKFSIDEVIGGDGRCAAAVRSRCEFHFSNQLANLGFHELPLRETGAGEDPLQDEALALGLQSGLLDPSVDAAMAVAAARRVEDLPVLARLLGKASD